MAIDSMSIAYNEATANDIAEQLLLNIARAGHNEPIHFSGISNIAATLNFQANIGATPALAGANGTAMMPILGAGVSENPTVSIIPMQGEEFTKRMLTPMTEDKLALLLRQNVDIDMLLRLAVLEYRSQQDGNSEIYHNRPRNRDDYTLFRRMALHLSSIQDSDHLFFEPVIVQKHWSIPIKSMSPKGFQSLEKEYNIKLDKLHDVYLLDKQVRGRIVISNYNPVQLTETERNQLNDETEVMAPDEILVDIRPEYSGGEYPLHGKLRLRSFSNIIYFIGRTISNEPEIDISKDPRTPDVSINPTFTLAISISDSKPDKTDLVVKFKDHYYSISPDKDYLWNETVFRILLQMFQMTMAELPKTAAPSITISK
ncbi:hypothetical protein [Methylomonas sp. AM2-LC]|uniref:hypothetical protein n=1 Tax=Methylomonas sp. AM2-LC TaxID=3153301 RepID=UPI00326680F2